MKIKEIHIENFRSIKNETIVMDKNCLILVGKNEAGKSNVLKAIAALFGQYPMTEKDQRKRINNEKIINRYIYATFEYKEDDVLKIESSLLNKYATIKDLTFKTGKTLKDYITSELPYVFYGINISNNAKSEFFHAEERQMNVVPEKDVYQNPCYSIMRFLFKTKDYCVMLNSGEIVEKLETEIIRIEKQMTIKNIDAGKAYYGQLKVEVIR